MCSTELAGFSSSAWVFFHRGPVRSTGRCLDARFIHLPGIFPFPPQYSAVLSYPAEYIDHCRSIEFASFIMRFLDARHFLLPVTLSHTFPCQYGDRPLCFAPEAQVYRRT